MRYIDWLRWYFLICLLDKLGVDVLYCTINWQDGLSNDSVVEVAGWIKLP